jgi:hypothetical protein
VFFFKILLRRMFALMSPPGLSDFCCVACDDISTLDFGFINKMIHVCALQLDQINQITSSIARTLQDRSRTFCCVRNHDMMFVRNASPLQPDQALAA